MKLEFNINEIRKNKLLSLAISILLIILTIVGIYWIDSPFLYTIANIFTLILTYIISISLVTYASTKLNFFKIGFDIEEYRKIENLKEKDAYIEIEKIKLLGKDIIYAFLLLGIAVIIGYGYSLIQFRM